MDQSAKMMVPSENPRVLIVDDDRNFADTLVSVLNSHGVEAEAAYNGAEAIERALTTLPDFILIDVVMEGIDGVDAAIAICETTPAPRVLLISGHPDAHRRLKKGSVRGHDFAFLVKPLQLTSLLQWLRSSDGRQYGRGTARAA